MMARIKGSKNRVKAAGKKAVRKACIVFGKHRYITYLKTVGSYYNMYGKFFIYQCIDEKCSQVNKSI